MLVAGATLLVVAFLVPPAQGPTTGSVAFSCDAGEYLHVRVADAPIKVHVTCGGEIADCSSMDPGDDPICHGVSPQPTLHADEGRCAYSTNARPGTFHIECWSSPDGTDSKL